MNQVELPKLFSRSKMPSFRPFETCSYVKSGFCVSRDFVCVTCTDLDFLFLSQSFIYWTVWGQTSKIMRARLDGTAETVLIREGIPFPNALALDESNRRLFWAGTDERKYGIIESVSLDGLNRNVTFYSQGYHPYSLDIYDGFVYWADWGKNAVLRISSNGDREEMVITGLKKPMGLKLFHMRTLDGKQGRNTESLDVQRTLYPQHKLDSGRA